MSEANAMCGNCKEFSVSPKYNWNTGFWCIPYKVWLNLERHEPRRCPACIADEKAQREAEK